MAVRDRIYNQIMERGWHPGRRAFVQHYDTDVLDASLLVMPLCKFIAPTDPRWISMLDAITAELVSDSLVYRYNVDASPDGLAAHRRPCRLQDESDVAGECSRQCTALGRKQ